MDMVGVLHHRYFVRLWGRENRRGHGELGYHSLQLQNKGVCPLQHPPSCHAHPHLPNPFKDGRQCALCTGLLQVHLRAPSTSPLEPKFLHLSHEQGGQKLKLYSLRLRRVKHTVGWNRLPQPPLGGRLASQVRQGKRNLHLQETWRPSLAASLLTHPLTPQVLTQ